MMNANITGYTLSFDLGARVHVDAYEIASQLMFAFPGVMNVSVHGDWIELGVDNDDVEEYAGKDYWDDFDAYLQDARSTILAASLLMDKAAGGGDG